MSLKKIIIILCIGAFSFSNANLYAQKNKKTSKEKINVDSLFTQAQIAFTMEKYPEAFEMFEKIVAIQPENAVANAQLSTLYFAQENFPAALSTIENALKSDPDNTTYQEYYAEIIANLGRNEEAASIYESLAKQGIDSKSNYIRAVIYHKLSEDYDKALEVLDILEKMDNEEEKENLALEKIKIYVILKEKENAINYIKKLISDNKDKPYYRLLLALSYKEFKDKENERNTLDEAIDLYPNDKFIVTEVMKYYLLENDTSKIKNFILDAQHSDKLNDEEKLYAFFPLLEARFDNRFAKDFIYEIIPKIAESPNASINAILLNGHLKYSDDLKEESLEQYKKANKIDKKDIRPWIYLFEYYINNKQADSVIEYFEEAHEYIPENPMPFYYNGIALFEKEKLDSAIMSLEKGKDLIQSNDPEEDKLRFYYILGMLYQQKEDVENTEKFYKMYLDIYAENELVLNNYSYLLAEENKDLEEALQMSAYTVQRKPNESMYLDTHGWVLFKLKEYAQAKYYLEKAIENAEKEESIYFEHLGDIEYELGNKKRANNLWKKAKQLGSDAKDLQEKIDKNK